MNLTRIIPILLCASLLGRADAVHAQAAGLSWISALEPKSCDDLCEKITWDQASQRCTAQGMRLPTTAELLSGFQGGLKILVPVYRANMTELRRRYWSSTIQKVGSKISASVLEVHIADGGTSSFSSSANSRTNEGRIRERESADAKNYAVCVKGSEPTSSSPSLPDRVAICMGVSGCTAIFDQSNTEPYLRCCVREGYTADQCQKDQVPIVGDQLLNACKKVGYR